MADKERASGSKSHKVEDILSELVDLTEGRRKISLGEIADSIGKRSYGPFLLVPALIEISPLGGIPGLPTFIALIIAIAAAQLMMGREHLWMPAFLEKHEIQAKRIGQAKQKLSRFARWLDRWFHGRLSILTDDPVPRLVGMIVFALCLTVPPLELVPFASSAPMLAIAAFGLALLVRDGLLMAFALIISLGSFVAGLQLALSGGG